MTGSAMLALHSGRPYEAVELFALSNAKLQFVPPMTEEARDYAWRLRKPTGAIFVHGFDPRRKR